MTDLRTAAQQALEALELVTDLTNHDDELYAAIDALRAALAEEALQRLTDANQEIEALAQAEPVAWMHTLLDDNVIHHRPADLDRHPERWKPLYTAPPRCPNCASLEAQNAELDRKLAELEKCCYGLDEGCRERGCIAVDNFKERR